MRGVAVLIGSTLARFSALIASRFSGFNRWFYILRGVAILIGVILARFGALIVSPVSGFDMTPRPFAFFRGRHCFARFTGLKFYGCFKFSLVKFSRVSVTQLFRGLVDISWRPNVSHGAVVLIVSPSSVD